MQSLEYQLSLHLTQSDKDWLKEGYKNQDGIGTREEWLALCLHNLIDERVKHEENQKNAELRRSGLWKV